MGNVKNLFTQSDGKRYLTAKEIIMIIFLYLILTFPKSYVKISHVPNMRV